MAIPLAKLQILWARGGTFPSERTRSIRKILNTWDENSVSIYKMTKINGKTPHYMEVTGGQEWNLVVNAFKGVLTGYAQSMVDDVDSLLHIKRKDKNHRFRIASNALPSSNYETKNTTLTQSNQESFFGTHNWPFEIAQYYLNSKIPKIPNMPSLSYDCASISSKSIPEQKFILKYFWMLANRDKYVPIFSLYSFYELVPIFIEIAKKCNPSISSIDWGVVNDKWMLSLSAFEEAWPTISNQLVKEITGTDYAELAKEDKERLMDMLFLASTEETTTKNALDMLKTGNQAMIFYGPPGTGKTYQAQEVAKELLGCTNQEDFDACEFSKTAPISNNPACTGRWQLVQFHPGYTYQDFIGGIMPQLTGSGLSYVLQEGSFNTFCKAAEVAFKNEKKSDNEAPKYIFIIDEINRADLSAVLGELMYALEYREKSVQIPNFGAFTIPKNVYIIGTMNSVDKSLVTFDLALRRRFLFFKIPPNVEALNDWNAKLNPRFFDDSLKKIIENAKWLNDNLSVKLNLSEDCKIGQAYFMKIKDFAVINASGALEVTQLSFERLWEYHIEPLLEEYLGAEFESRKKDLSNLKDYFTK